MRRSHFLTVLAGLLLIGQAHAQSYYETPVDRDTPLHPTSTTIESNAAVAVVAAGDSSCESKGCESKGCESKGCECQSTCTSKSGGCCDGCRQAALREKAAKAHNVLFFKNDFNYLCDPCYCGPYFLGDNLKRIGVGNCGNLDIGGQVRLRYHHELGMKGERFRDVEDDFLLTRVRLYADYRANDMVRFFIEGLYADSSFEDEPPRVIDENFGDIHNAFVDLSLTSTTTARVGRQELLYGAQRLVSPLDWANTRRRFEGVNLMYREGDLALDGFFVNEVPPVSNRFDEADYNRKFYGTYAVYSGLENATVDMYYLGFDDTNQGLSLHTMGARVNGSCPCSNWMYEVEGASQFGKRATGVDQDGEGFLTAGLGYKITDCGWKPTVWAYFDYASENFNHLFPLAHKYLGFIDAVQRQNIESPNLLLTMQPTSDTKLLIWYYHFQTNSDAIVPGVGGTPSQNSSRYYGNELDILGTYNLSARSQVQLGWSHLWRGNKINNPQDADFVYMQYQHNF